MTIQAGAVDPSLAILSFWSGKSEAQNGDSGVATPTTDTKPGQLTQKKTAMIASAAALGAIVLGVAGFFGSRWYLQKKARESRMAQNHLRKGSGNEEFSSFDAARNRGINDEEQEYIADGQPFMQGLPTPVRPPMPFTPARSMAETIGSRYTQGDQNGRMYGYSPPSGGTALQNPYGRSNLGQATPPPVTGRSAPTGAFPLPRDSSYVNTMRSGSGSSVQSDVLQTRRRASSLDLADPGRNTWWRHESQWGPPETAQPAVPAASSLPEPRYSGRPPEYRPYSTSSSRYSTMRRPTLQRGRDVRSDSISAPYLQDNSLML